MTATTKGLSQRQLKTIRTDKLKNHKYSPGIATYGLRGPAGKDGLHGNGFFICAYNLSNTESETRTIAINKLNNNEYLSDNVNEKITRKYLANDLIIDITGSIYSVVEVQNEQGMIERLSFSEEPIGNIELINEAGLNARIFNTGVFKRIVNNADIEGLDIVTDTELLKSDEYNDINSRKYPIRIFNSDKDIINDGNKAPITNNKAKKYCLRGCFLYFGNILLGISFKLRSEW